MLSAKLPHGRLLAEILLWVVGWRQTFTNLIRNSTERLGAGNRRWNQFIYDTAAKMHRDVNGPATAPCCES